MLGKVLKLGSLCCLVSILDILAISALKLQIARLFRFENDGVWDIICRQQWMCW